MEGGETKGKGGGEKGICVCICGFVCVNVYVIPAFLKTHA